MRVLFALALLGCATAQAPPRCVPMPTPYERCVDHCATEQLGEPLLWENQNDRSCFCKKAPVGT